MDYDIRDLARYMGLIVGCSGTFTILGQLGVEMYIPKLLAGIVVGVGMGYIGHLVTEPEADEKTETDE